MVMQTRYSESGAILPEIPFERCPIRSSLGVFGRKWALLVLRDVAFFKSVNFSQIMKNNPGLTPRVLVMRLKDLQKEGLIERAEDPDDDRVVRWSLTRKGQDAIPILTSFIQYGAVHHAQRVFEDRKPRAMSQLFPEREKIMLGKLFIYAKTAARPVASGLEAKGRKV